MRKLEIAIELGGELFEGPFPINEWTPIEPAGVYCLMVPDGHWGPASYRPIFFGESGDFGKRAFPPARNGHAGWLRIADYDLPIHIATHWMRDSTPQRRKALEDQLIRLYAPECNQSFLACPALPQ